jgi:hypothetical protein
MLSAPWSVVFVLGTSIVGCGGSSSETPFPEEPLPEYMRRQPTSKSPQAVEPAPAKTATVSPPKEKAEPAREKGKKQSDAAELPATESSPPPATTPAAF